MMSRYQENRLASARGRIRSVLQVHFVDDDELRILRALRRRGAEETEQRTVWPKHAGQLIRELLGVGRSR